MLGIETKNITVTYLMFMQSVFEREQQDGRTRPQEEGRQKRSRAEAETTMNTKAYTKAFEY